MPNTARTVLPEEVRATFGDLDDLVVARIVGTGATPAEVVEAYARLHAGVPRSAGKASNDPRRVDQVIELVQADLEAQEEA